MTETKIDLTLNDKLFDKARPIGRLSEDIAIIETETDYIAGIAVPYFEEPLPRFMQDNIIKLGFDILDAKKKEGDIIDIYFPKFAHDLFKSNGIQIFRATTSQEIILGAFDIYNDTAYHIKQLSFAKNYPQTIMRYSGFMMPTYSKQRDINQEIAYIKRNENTIRGWLDIFLSQSASKYVGTETRNYPELYESFKGINLP